jgi:hypothetical protein
MPYHGTKFSQADGTFSAIHERATCVISTPFTEFRTLFEDRKKGKDHIDIVTKRNIFQRKPFVGMKSYVL